MLCTKTQHLGYVNEIESSYENYNNYVKLAPSIVNIDVWQLFMITNYLISV